MTYKKSTSTNCRGARQTILTSEGDIAKRATRDLFTEAFGHLRAEQAVSECARIMGSSLNKARQVREGHSGIKLADLIAILRSLPKKRAMQIYLSLFIEHSEGGHG